MRFLFLAIQEQMLQQKTRFAILTYSNFYYSVDKQNPLEKLHSYTIYGCIKIPSHF